jgi:hypothetical protein
LIFKKKESELVYNEKENYQLSSQNVNQNEERSSICRSRRGLLLLGTLSGGR